MKTTLSNICEGFAIVMSGPRRIGEVRRRIRSWNLTRRYVLRDWTAQIGGMPPVHGFNTRAEAVRYIEQHAGGVR